MLHRVKKENDENKDKWIGIGGKFEEGESPEECVLREIREETGICPDALSFRGIVTFVSAKWGTEYMHLFTAECSESAAHECEKFPCDEGKLEWVPVEVISNLPIWEGDKIFLRLLKDNEPFFSLKLIYDENDTLISAVLNGKCI